MIIPCAKCGREATYCGCAKKSAKPDRSLLEHLEQPTKSFAQHLVDAWDCVATARPLLPGRKLEFRRESVLMICESIIWLAMCATGNHESQGPLIASTEHDTVKEWSVCVDGEGGYRFVYGMVAVCKRCSCVYWSDS